MREVPLPPPSPLHEREGLAAPADLAARRSAARAALPACPDNECRLGDAAIRALRFNPQGASRATVLHWHGGGFRLGSPEYAAPFAAALAQACNVEVICPEYRLAPEHPFPAGLIDGLAAIEGALALGVGRLILSGDSAGGGLAASLAALCAQRGITLAGLVLISPWLDLTVSAPSFQECGATDPLFSQAAASEAAEQYLQGHPASDPLASPLFFGPTRFPPACISAGSGEVLRDDAERLHEKLLAARRTSRLLVVPGMEHVAALRGQDLTGSAEVFRQVSEFVSGLVRPGNAAQSRRASPRQAESHQA